MKIDKNKTCYIFDLDGTLSEPRKKVDKQNKEMFIEWAKNRQCFICTGSDFVKVKQQLDQEMLDQFIAIFCCMGNSTHSSSGIVLRKVNFIVPDDLNVLLEDFMINSDFPYRTGNHFEVRPGMLNFSIVGRNANQKQREEYKSYDKENQERANIAKAVNEGYTDLEASIGGSISIDIIPKGRDKGQVISFLRSSGVEKIVFVGDRCFPGGNDHGIIRELKKSDIAFEWYNVSSVKETYRLIKENKVFSEGK